MPAETSGRATAGDPGNAHDQSGKAKRKKSEVDELFEMLKKAPKTQAVQVSKGCSLKPDDATGTLMSLINVIYPY